MSALRNAGLAMIAFLMAYPAASQGDYVRLGSRIPHFPREYREMIKEVDPADPVSVANAHQAFTRCIAVNRAEKALPVIAMPLYGAEQVAAITKLFDAPQGCLGENVSEMRVTAPLMIGGITEAFIVNDPATVATVEGLQEMDEGELAEITGRTPIETMAICSVRKNPKEAIALLKSGIRSAEERAAIQLISADLGQCIPAGVEASFNLPSLRAIVASGVYLVALAEDSASTSEIRK